MTCLESTSALCRNHLYSEGLSWYTVLHTMVECWGKFNLKQDWTAINICVWQKLSIPHVHLLHTVYLTKRALALTGLFIYFFWNNLDLAHSDNTLLEWQRDNQTLKLLAEDCLHLSASKGFQAAAFLYSCALIFAKRYIFTCPLEKKIWFYLITHQLKA